MTNKETACKVPVKNWMKPFMCLEELAGKEGFRSFRSITEREAPSSCWGSKEKLEVVDRHIYRQTESYVEEGWKD